MNKIIVYVGVSIVKIHRADRGTFVYYDVTPASYVRLASLSRLASHVSKPTLQTIEYKF